MRATGAFHLRPVHSFLLAAIKPINQAVLTYNVAQLFFGPERIKYWILQHGGQHQKFRSFDIVRDVADEGELFNRRVGVVLVADRLPVQPFAFRHFERSMRKQLFGCQRGRVKHLFDHFGNANCFVLDNVAMDKDFDMNSIE